MQIEILLNGKPYIINEQSNVRALIDSLGLEQSQIAVELNREIVSRSRYLEVFLNSGDEVEIVSFIGGG